MRKKPFMGIKNRNIMAIPAANGRLLNKDTATSGSPPRCSSRCCSKTKQARTSTPRAMDTNVQAGQFSSRPMVRGYRMASMPTARITTPDRSNLCRTGALDSGTNLTAQITAKMPTGMLTKKMVRQPQPKRSASVRIFVSTTSFTNDSRPAFPPSRA